MTNAEISFTPQNNCPIQITDVSEGNNITLLFNENDSDISCLFHSLNNIRKVDFTHFKNKISKIDYIFFNCNNLEEVTMAYLDTSSVTNMAGMMWQNGCAIIFSMISTGFREASARQSPMMVSSPAVWQSLQT